MGKVLDIWYKSKAFSILPRFRKNSYFELPSWWSIQEVPIYMIFTFPSVIYFQYGILFGDDSIVCQHVSANMRMEFRVMIEVLFMKCERRGLLELKLFRPTSTGLHWCLDSNWDIEASRYRRSWVPKLCSPYNIRPCLLVTRFGAFGSLLMAVGIHDEYIHSLSLVRLRGRSIWGIW